MTSHARRRLIRDFKKLQSDPPHGVSGAPIKNDIMKWNAVIFGPEDTAWEGATFQLEMCFSDDYPNKAPRVRFLSKLFHPNVYNDGNICLDILQNQWSPIYDISAILTSIQSLLSDPNPNSPANSEAARLYAENRREYNRRVQQCVVDSWKSLEVGATAASSSSTSEPATAAAISSSEEAATANSSSSSETAATANSSSNSSSSSRAISADAATTTNPATGEARANGGDPEDGGGERERNHEHRRGSVGG